MSDKATQELADHIKAQAEMETRKQKVLAEELRIRERNATNKIKKLEENDRNEALAKKINYGQMSAEDVERIVRDNTNYMGAARDKMCFMNKHFNHAVPYFQKNLILIAGRTGDGKSTTVANIIRETISKVNPKTMKKRRVLVITNEERTEDVLNRVTCLIKGWDYRNHEKFTDEQVATFNHYIKMLTKDGMVTVIDNNFGGSLGTTTTVEGICQIFDNLIENKEYFDVVIIDYYQNIMHSRNMPELGPYQVQEKVAQCLDGYKNVYPAPIILLAQVMPQDKDKKTPFKFRIEGRKSILNVATCCMEMVADKSEMVTDWHVHKSRFNGAVGEIVKTGYDDGAFVEWNTEFREKVAKWKANAEKEAFDRQVGLHKEKKDGNDGSEDGSSSEGSGSSET